MDVNINEIEELVKREQEWQDGIRLRPVSCNIILHLNISDGGLLTFKDLSNYLRKYEDCKYSIVLHANEKEFQAFRTLNKGKIIEGYGPMMHGYISVKTEKGTWIIDHDDFTCVPEIDYYKKKRNQSDVVPSLLKEAVKRIEMEKAAKEAEEKAFKSSKEKDQKSELYNTYCQTYTMRCGGNNIQDPQSPFLFLPAKVTKTEKKDARKDVSGMYMLSDFRKDIDEALETYGDLPLSISSKGILYKEKCKNKVLTFFHKFMGISMGSSAPHAEEERNFYEILSYQIGCDKFNKE